MHTRNASHKQYILRACSLLTFTIHCWWGITMGKRIGYHAKNKPYSRVSWLWKNHVANHTSNNLPHQDLDIIIRQASQQLERVHIDDQISCWSYRNAKQVGLTIPFFKQHLFLWFWSRQGVSASPRCHFSLLPAACAAVPRVHVCYTMALPWLVSLIPSVIFLCPYHATNGYTFNGLLLVIWGFNLILWSYVVQITSSIYKKWHFTLPGDQLAHWRFYRGWMMEPKNS